MSNRKAAMQETAQKLQVTPYAQSLTEDVFMAYDANGEDVLVADGEIRPLTAEAAAFLRERFPFTKPVPVLRRERTFGVGDRLGIACPGHIRVFARYDCTPVFAQQSMRELTLTNRTYQDVLDCVTFSVFRAHYTGGFGADGDHLKRAEDIQNALSIGYSMITLDCSDHIREDGASAALCEDMRTRYLDKVFDIGEGLTLSFTEEELSKIVHIYENALVFAGDIWNRFFAEGKAEADFEISIDETATPTSPLQHFFVANELRNRGVDFATLAPRFCGEFQKGVDYIGDLEQFDAEMRLHAQLARHFGYKLSIHSGSDKFSVFPSIGKQTRGVFHVKTAGTNWLEAMRVVAQVDPSLYRRTHAFALDAFAEASQYYHVTTNLKHIPALDTLGDAQLPALFDQNDARQLIHITYGLILQDEQLHRALYAVWKEHAEEYAKALERHIGKHMELLGVKTF